MNNNYSILKDKLVDSYKKNNKIIDSDLQKKFNELSSKFIITSDKREISKVLKEKLVNNYEEIKSGVTFATLIEKLNNFYFVSMTIFDKDFIYSNILKKKLTSLDLATLYFEELKQAIINNDKDSLSFYILNKMSNA